MTGSLDEVVISVSGVVSVVSSVFGDAAYSYGDSGVGKIMSACGST